MASSKSKKTPYTEDGWTFEEVKKFETILDEFDSTTPPPPAFFQQVAREMTWKTMKDIILHYHLLMRDLNIIRNSDVEMTFDEAGNSVYKIRDEQSFESQSEKQAKDGKGKGDVSE